MYVAAGGTQSARSKNDAFDKLEMIKEEWGEERGWLTNYGRDRLRGGYELEGRGRDSKTD